MLGLGRCTLVRLITASEASQRRVGPWTGAAGERVMLPSVAYSVYSVLLFRLSALHMSYKGLRTQAERSGGWRQARKMRRERSQANSIFLNPLGSSSWALAYVCVSSPRVSRSISPIWMLERKKFLVLTGIRGWSQTWGIAGSPKPRWLVPTLSPIGAHCSFV